MEGKNRKKKNIESNFSTTANIFVRNNFQHVLNLIFQPTYQNHLIRQPANVLQSYGCLSFGGLLRLFLPPAIFSFGHFSFGDFFPIPEILSTCNFRCIQTLIRISLKLLFFFYQNLLCEEVNNFYSSDFVLSYDSRELLCSWCKNNTIYCITL